MGAYMIKCTVTAGLTTLAKNKKNGFSLMEHEGEVKA
jgi:hypothetical protein